MDPDKVIKTLDPWPILQAGFVVFWLMVSGYVIWRAVFDKRGSPVPPGAPPEARWFFEGPMNVALTYLRDISKNTETMTRELQEHGESLRQHTRTLDEMRLRQQRD